MNSFTGVVHRRQPPNAVAENRVIPRKNTSPSPFRRHTAHTLGCQCTVNGRAGDGQARGDQ